MSRTHDTGHAAHLGKIKHTTSVLEHIGSLYLNDKYSDVTLFVDGHHFKCHKLILATRCEYFRALLYSNMQESTQSEIKLKGISHTTMKDLLRYIYTGQLSLVDQKVDAVIEILGLSHQYGLSDLERDVSDYLGQIIQTNNVLMIYDAAQLYQQNFLAGLCDNFMDKNAQDVMCHESFLRVSPVFLKQFISRDSLHAPEAKKFCRIVNWIEANQINGSECSTRECTTENSFSSSPSKCEAVCTQAAVEVLSTIHLAWISPSDLLSIVRPSNLISDTAILDAFQAINAARGKEPSGILVPEENLAHEAHGAQVLQGEMGSSLFITDSKNVDNEADCTRHVIHGDQGILIQLQTEAVLNYMKMRLWDNDKRSYSYFIEVSVDKQNWVRVIDHTLYLCRSWQYLHFEARVVRFIRIVGTKNTSNKSFHILSFQAMYTCNPMALYGCLIVPKVNVASSEYSASLIGGEKRPGGHQSLLGDVNNYDRTSGFTCHRIGQSPILVQLAQPYVLNSMRLLLWDKGDPPIYYRYYVEVSVNLLEWERVVDNSGKNCRSWQTLHFPQRPVVFIRIVGTAGVTFPEDHTFHCVHLECPALTTSAVNQATE